MKANDGKADKHKSGTDRSLKQALELITDAGKTIASVKGQAQPSYTGDDAKDHWDKSQKLAALAHQRSAKWIQSLALIVSGVGCCLAGYAAVVSTVQAITSNRALSIARDALKIGQRPYVAADLPSTFETDLIGRAYINQTFKNFGNSVARLQSVCARINEIKQPEEQNEDGYCIAREGKYNFHDSDLFRGEDRSVQLVSYPGLAVGRYVQISTSSVYKDQENNTYMKHTCGVYEKIALFSYKAINHCSAWNDTLELR